ncbi:fatty acid desaturase family protein [Anabaena azotica]|uniref:Fatty acid desaturase family protein n=1 Tax=Anabaena azotica FACHB-119 TaxID=947527 RepID=A0ABR8DGF1_9NOST|nr:fatty acid desaturase family protein [Anabaena azotica]MBD2505191.1 fatty acid desaturase family protein [Anabaena azotica FACHB-119]
MYSGEITQLESADPQTTQHQKPHQLLSTQEIKVLNSRSNAKGLLQLALHLTVMACSGYLWGTNWGNWALAIPSLVVYGFSIAAMFAPMHECVHRTAFAAHPLNNAVAWCAGVLSFYNSAFFRYYHKWHHLYTRVPDKDPELTDPIPSNFAKYLLIISGLPWWLGKISGHFQIAFGQIENFPFIPESARTQVIRSTRLQLAVYAGMIAVSIVLGQPLFIIYWLLPLMIGQPILRFILLAEHRGCTLDGNLLTNTRTTITLWPVRFFMWSMCFHAEHHLYPSIPFHALGDAHKLLSQHFIHIEPGYIKVNSDIVIKSGQSAI